MGKFIVNILMCFVSVILLFFAPDVYSYVYCLLLLFIYILFNIIYLLQDHKNRIFSFEFLFMVSFFCQAKQYFFRELTIYGAQD